MAKNIEAKKNLCQNLTLKYDSIDNQTLPSGWVLRDYQKETVNETLNQIKENDTIIVLPTGGGKSIVTGSLVDILRKNDLKCGIILRTTVLIEQVKNTLESLNFRVGIIKDGYDFEENNDVLLIMEQTFYNRYKTNNYGKIDVLIKDEIHIGSFEGKQAKKVKNYFKPKRIIGLTATPINEKSKKLYPEWSLVEKVTTLDLIEDNFLMEPEWRLINQSNLIGLNRIALSGNDYSTKDLDKLVNTKKINNIITKEVQYYLKDNRKIILFCNSINHIETLSEYFSKADIEHSKLHSGISKSDTQRNLEDYKSNKTRVMINMSILTTGFDDPEIDCLFFLRPTKVLRLAIQIMGRALRINKGKRKPLIIDSGRILETHGFLEYISFSDSKFNEDDELITEKSDDGFSDINDDGRQNVKELIKDYKMKLLNKRNDELISENIILKEKISFLERELKRLKIELTGIDLDYIEQPCPYDKKEETATKIWKLNQKLRKEKPHLAVTDTIINNIRTLINEYKNKVKYLEKSTLTRSKNLISQNKSLRHLEGFIKWRISES